MKDLGAGATGRTGLHQVQELIDLGQKPAARDCSEASALPDGVDLRKGDLTNLQDDVYAGMVAVIFAAGSGGSFGPDMTDRWTVTVPNALLIRRAKQG